MLVGCFMCLEAEYALGNKGRAACRQAMDFVIEACAFEQQAGGSREGDRALLSLANGAHAGFITWRLFLVVEGLEAGEFYQRIASGLGVVGGDHLMDQFGQVERHGVITLPSSVLAA